MNFYDFFIFLVRFTLANMLLLYHLKVEKSSHFFSSIEVVQRLISNLVAIEKVAECMESVEAFTEDNLSHFSGEDWRSMCDINRIIQEDRFKEFAMAITASIEQNNEPKGLNLDFSVKSFLSDPFFQELNFLHSSKQSLCDPVSLIRLIEYYFLYPDGICNGIDLSLFPDI